MSSRRRRQQQQQQQQLQELEEIAPSETSSNHDDDSEEEDKEPSKSNAAFLLMMEDDEDSSSSEEEEEEKIVKAPTPPKNKIMNKPKNVSRRKKKQGKKKKKDSQEEDEEEEEDETKKEKEDSQKDEEDLDAILSEFQSTSIDNSKNGETVDDSSSSVCSSVLLRKDIPLRDYDLDTTLRSMLGGVVMMMDDNNNANNANAGMVQRRRGVGSNNKKITFQKKFVFGKPKEEWGRPPNYIGGGLGMDTTLLTPPWPYTTNTTSSNNDSQWWVWKRSDTYVNQVLEFDQYIQRSGDLNTLALFVADNPYVVESIYQLSKALEQFHDTKEHAQELLRRSLWIYECAATPNFFTSPKIKMDYQLEENQIFFQSLHQYLQYANKNGCIVTCLALSRFLLSLDPLRDPMAVLLSMDYYALASMQPTNWTLMLQLIQSNSITIHHRMHCEEKGEEIEYSCELVDMPNWSFSYALALYKLSLESDDEDDLLEEKANEALTRAIEQYPFVPQQLLEQNKVDIKGRSFQMDWPTVLVKLYHKTNQIKTEDPHGYDAANHIITNFFIPKNSALWNSDTVLKWLYENCVLATTTTTPKTNNIPIALQRYLQFSSDDDNRTVMLPAEANPLDPQLIRPAVQFDAARRLPRMRRGPQQQQLLPNENLQEMILAQQQQLMMMATAQQHPLDPDMPMAELFLRSFMPWNSVEGVPPNNNNNNNPPNNP